MKKVNSLILCLFPAAISFSQQKISVSAGTIDFYEAFESDFVDPRNISVWKPENYGAHKRYAVLYMHDGQMLFDSTITWNKQEWGVDETMQELLVEGKINDCIVVGIWNNGEKRYQEYFPAKPFFMIAENDRKTMMEVAGSNNRLMPESGPASDEYLKFIVRELKPFIDARYSVHYDKQHTFIAGSSMGGLISMYALCEYPKVFGGAACLSTHWPGVFQQNDIIPGAFLKYMEKNLPSLKNHKLYFDFGTQTLDSLYEKHQLKVDALIQKKKYVKKNLLSRKYTGEDHSEKAWAKRLHIPLEFLLSEN